LLQEAKRALPHGAFIAMLERELPFSPRWAQQMMKIADNPVLSDAKHASLLPPSVQTLAELATLSPGAIQQKIDSGAIHSKMQRKDARRLRPGAVSDLFKKKRRQLEPVKEMHRRIEQLQERCVELEQERDHAQERSHEDVPLLNALHTALATIDKHVGWPAGNPQFAELRYALERVIALMEAEVPSAAVSPDGVPASKPH
jgi:hypothetical protein